MLDLAGVDTSTFKANSVRGTSISAAASAGLMTNQILNVADWSSESVFGGFTINLSRTTKLVLKCYPLNLQIHYKHHADMSS